ncbi:MAG TPA: hypothetical protein VFD98_00940 [Terracidiphilus sp.]|jgi:hypothetical protein|nr:hypothetical protein [Terracidiphilus sp.]
MHKRSNYRFRIVSRAILTVAATALLVGLHLAAQTRPTAPAAAPAAAPPAPVPTDRDVSSTQTQLIKLLRLSPTLTTVVARDPSLLSNQEYVAKNNPQLAEFLASHPEVTRNPDFYLFTHMNRDGGPDEAIERAVWPDVYRAQSHTGFDELMGNLPPVFALVCFLLSAAWTLRLFVENRRWSRIFTLQNEVHSKLIDKFSSSQELAAYMETDAGKRFLEAAPIPVNLGSDQRVPNAVARVLTPIQIGVVLVLLGVGFLLLRHAGPDMEMPMRVLGTVILMPGIGFIISAGITWVLATRLGLMPPRSEAPYDAPPASRLGTPFGSTDRQ